jgi:hypothetical protein
MQKIAKEIAELITSVPEWQKDFPINIPSEYEQPNGLSELPIVK